MKDNLNPQLCHYCYDMEKYTTSTSHRILKSSEEWSISKFDEIRDISWDYDYLPSYLEIGFSNTCNLKCSYCTLESSSKWLEEIANYGPFEPYKWGNSIEQSQIRGSLPNNDNNTNPYKQAFWRLWPKLYKNLKAFRITGGEPFLINETDEILDYIINIDEPNINLQLSINTNLMVNENKLNQLINKFNILINENKVKNIIIYASIDTVGNQSEYARFGLDENLFWNNINTLLTNIPKLSIVIMSTYTIFSLNNFHNLIKKTYDLNLVHNNGNRFYSKAVTLSTTVAIFPRFLSVRLLFDEMKEQIINNYESLSDDIKNSLSPIEKNLIKMVYEWSKSNLTEFNIINERKNFITFVDEHDVRRGTNFLETFPQLADFYNTIKDTM
jgi:organic radical activating enzyme